MELTQVERDLAAEKWIENVPSSPLWQGRGLNLLYQQLIIQCGEK